MKFTKEFLEEDLSSKDTVRDEIVAHKRWTVVHRITFQHEGKFYQTEAHCPATECQENQPFDWSDDPVECKEVFPVEKTVTVYEEAAG